VSSEALSSVTSRPQFAVSAPRCDRPHDRPDECAYRVAWAINPHMRVGSTQACHAERQHARFCDALARAGASVVELPFVHGAYDCVFAKDSAVLLERGGARRALLASPRHDERRREQAERAEALGRLGFEVEAAPPVPFEGGDVVMLPGCRGALLGHGFRSSPAAAAALERFLGAPVVALALRDPHLYHLDTALAVLDDGTALLCRDAFDADSLRRLERAPGVTRLVDVGRDEALRFGLNLVEIGRRVVLGSASPRAAFLLRSLGREPVVVNLDQFQNAGGSAACLVARVHQAGAVAVTPTTAMRSAPARA
ncbi:MAG TPA: arginine deiminase-related protein, partial [Polyangiaceae bacterium]|nr:arginine deiminase-related protein [Polyangiaceae bacterium]